ncbi:two-component sensor histidine kinase [Rhizobium sp. KVB221]|uniref:histidine kinase n=1 Tax=Rhizobium setariae TaxID=2801340 RepID=A0A936YSA6_9HYPH|nr:ATP-binding protein [Rhizobium setariae]MBL0371956.1 two-component sensor histidine kinase [Rhizobium setariae]
MTEVDASTRIDATARPQHRDRPWERFMRRNLPRGLFVRSLLIIIIPMVILQSVIAAVFMERHWQMVTTRLSAAVTRDVAAVIDLLDTFPNASSDAELIRIAKQRLGLEVEITPGSTLPAPKPIPLFSILDRTLSRQINQQISRPFWLNTSADEKTVEIRIKLDQNRILSVTTRRDRTYASNTHIFLIWMVGTSLFLILISILFLRGQIRPIEALTRAAEGFGKGQKSTDPFVPRGADEVRRAGYAFLQMRERIERQIEQRTMMLSGVSHDLRTILTRFRLQLAIAESMKDLEGLNRDVDDMNTMLDGYLDFARGETEEQQAELDLGKLLDQLEESAQLHGADVTTALEGPATVIVRPVAFARLLTNLVANAWRHAHKIHIEARNSGRFLTVTVDDDGPGVPEAMREEVFKPFFRLDEARNLDASGTGLGLAIVRDIARSHGGNVTLSQSPLGGLRATVRVPV